MSLESFVIIILVGGLILLSFIKLSGAIKVNTKGNFYFGIFTLIWSSFWIDELLFQDLINSHAAVYILTRFIQFLIPLPLYFSILFYTQPDYKFSLKDIKYIYIPVLFLILILNRYRFTDITYLVLYTIIIHVHAITLITLSYLRILRHQKNIEAFSSNKESIDLNWIRYIIISICSVVIIIVIYNIFLPAEQLNIYINLFSVAVVYFITFHSIRQKEIFPHTLQSGEDKFNEIIHISDDIEETSRNNRLMSESEIRSAKENLQELMNREKPYLDSELNLVKLAEKINLSSHQLSYVINNGFGENFFHFINKYRVQKAEELLRDSDNDHLTILAIGFEAGFNSKTSFNTTFKKITSYTPSEYRKVRSDL